jgi:hypothetical protein
MRHRNNDSGTGCDPERDIRNCEHPNECPHVCPCDAGCPCREGICALLPRSGYRIVDIYGVIADHSRVSPEWFYTTQEQAEREAVGISPDGRDGCVYCYTAVQIMKSDTYFLLDSENPNPLTLDKSAAEDKRQRRRKRALAKLSAEERELLGFKEE